MLKHLTATAALVVASAGVTESRASADPVFSGHARPRMNIAGYGSVVWADPPPDQEDVSIADAIDNLDLLTGRSVALSVQFRSEDFENEERWMLVEEAKRRGIPLEIGVVLPEYDPRHPERFAQTGFFANTTNYVEYIEQSERLMDLWLARGFEPTAIGVDMETRRERLEALADIPITDLTRLLAFYRLNRASDAEHEAAVAAFRGFVDRAHLRGFRVGVTTLVQVLNDFEDGDAGIRKALGIPLDDGPLSPAPIAWDAVYFQAYRTLYASQGPLGPWFVYEYGLRARRYFGAKAGLNVGLTHPGIGLRARVYRDPSELAADVRAARAAGIPRANISVFNFLGFWTNVGPRVQPEDWLVPPQPPRPPPYDLRSGLFQLATGAVDTVLR